MLEITHTPPQSPSHGNIVLVHGAWHGAWCWEHNFQPYFAQIGYDVYALSLRGHAGSTADKRLNRLNISDYADDVWSVVQSLSPGDTYLFGHSMGGYIVQKFLETHSAAVKKAVLIASVPPNGVTLRILKTIQVMGFWSFLKMNILFDLYEAVNTTHKVRAVCFSPDDADALVDYTASRVQGESFWAYLNMLNPHYIRPKAITTPIVVVSGGQDWLFSPAEQQVLVDTYRASQLMYPDKPHNLFATDGWEQVAADIQKMLYL